MPIAQAVIVETHGRASLPNRNNTLQPKHKKSAVSRIPSLIPAILSSCESKFRPCGQSHTRPFFIATFCRQKVAKKPASWELGRTSDSKALQQLKLTPCGARGSNTYLLALRAFSSAVIPALVPLGRHRKRAAPFYGPLYHSIRSRPSHTLMFKNTVSKRSRPLILKIRMQIKKARAHAIV
jgi:hypothetical protein